MNLIEVALAITVGRLVLSLPKKDLEKINKILKEHYGIAKVQEEDNSTHGL